jgi:DNA-binding transcriptional MocR family regulator
MEWVPTISKELGPLYRQISDAIETDIANGRLRRGQQLPTHRALAGALGIDLTTVTRAYNDARHRGLLEARVGQGTFVSESTTRVAADIADNGGNEPDREVVGSWLQPRLSTATRDRIVIYPGSQAAIFNILLSFLKTGDAVLTETLTFPGMKAAAAKLGIRLIGVAMDGQGVLPDALAKTIKLHKPKAVYLTPTMHNPTTATMRKARRKEVAEVLRDSKPFLIEDDAYGALDPSQQLLADLIPEKTFVTISLSKCIAPALRVSFLLTPDSQSALDLRASLQATCQMAPPLMVTLVMEWLRSGEAARIITAISEEAIGRQQLAARLLRGHPFAAHAKGHHLWLPLPDRWNRSGFVTELFRRGLAVVGSEAFAVGEPVPHAVRLCLGAARNRAELGTALQLLARTLSRPTLAAQVV